jgi:hypothetical protein
MIDIQAIKRKMPVVCSNDGPLGVVDQMVGRDSIKLGKDAKGKHHYIPVSWVSTVDDKVHVDRPGEQAMTEWTTTAP